MSDDQRKVTGPEVVNLLKAIGHGFSELDAVIPGQTWDSIFAGNFECFAGKWRITIFIDCGEFDYVDFVSSPDGRVANYEDLFLEDGSTPHDRLQHESQELMDKVDAAFRAVNKRPAVECEHFLKASDACWEWGKGLAVEQATFREIFRRGWREGLEAARQFKTFRPVPVPDLNWSRIDELGGGVIGYLDYEVEMPLFFIQGSRLSGAFMPTTDEGDFGSERMCKHVAQSYFHDWFRTHFPSMAPDSTGSSHSPSPVE